MYAPKTILALKEQRPPTKVPAKKDPDSGRVRKAHELPFPYNEVRVVGISPVGHDSGDPGIIISPLTGHGSTLDEPLSKLQKLYSVKEEPVEEIDVSPVRVIRADTSQAGPSPEEVFAVEAPGKPAEPGQTRARTSPLGDVETEDPNASPLGD